MLSLREGIEHGFVALLHGPQLCASGAWRTRILLCSVKLCAHRGRQSTSSIMLRARSAPKSANIVASILGSYALEHVRGSEVASGKRRLLRSDACHHGSRADRIGRRTGIRPKVAHGGAY